MLTKTEKLFSLLFFIIVIVDLICGSMEQLLDFRYITKPAIVVSLIIFFWRENNSLIKSIQTLTLLALMFSLIGDLLLLFVNRSPKYFMLGLIAFLIAHVMYLLVFLKHRNRSKTPWVFLGALLVYAFGLFCILGDGLGEMLIPILMYMIIILTMTTCAFLRVGRVPKISYQWVLLGAILFLISDSLLALHTFYRAIPFANVFIMLSYVLAQYFIVMGIKKSP